ncbi:MAG: hypothetical protein ABIL62_17945 [Planctomycetota bacterium]
METQEKQSYLRRLPDSAVAFINRVIKKMRYRKKVRSEVMAELTAHFEDELKDCKTDEENEQKAQQLITGFGDLKLLAILLHRAKKRCRPLWRTVVARTFQAVGVLILCFIFYVVWFLSGKPVITTNYVAEFNKIVRPPADESLNAAPLYLKAVGLHKELSDDFLLFFAQNHQAISEELSDEFLMFFALNYQAIADEKGQNKVEVLADRVNELLSNRKRLNFQEERENIQDIVSKLFSQFLRKKYNDFTVEQRNIVERWVQEHNDALELIIEGSRKPYYWRTYKSDSEKPGEMISVPVPDLAIFRDLAYSLRLRIWLSAEQSRFKDAFDHAKSCYRFGQQIRGDKTLIEQLVGIAIEAIAVRTIRDIVGGYEIDSTILADFQRDFEQIIADENFTISLKAKRLFMYDEIQRCFTSDRIGKGHLYLPRFRKISDLAGSYEEEGVEPFILDLVYSVPFLFGHPNKEETLKSVNELYDYCEQLSLKTAAQIHADSDAIDDKLNKLSSDNILIGILTPAVKRIIEIGNRLPTDVGAALTIIAILRYNGDTGRYPQNLNQLVTDGYLKQLPMDSFADKPLSYKKTEDNFILYSVGPDFKDDGGVSGKGSKGRARPWRDNGDTVFWPLPESDIKQ